MAVMLGRIWWLDCYWLLLERLNPSLSQPGCCWECREEQRNLRNNWDWVGPALRKGTEKPPISKEKAFVLAGLPGVAFSWLCGQWQRW